jgi:hypothetical protein
MSGLVYAPAALLTMKGDSQNNLPLVVNQLKLSGEASSTLTADGSSTSSDSASAGQLLAGDLWLSINDPSGLLTSDELARIQDAITTLNTVLAPYNVSIIQVDASSADLANVILDTGPTTAVGGLADGVLGCETPGTASTEITLVQGWNWYAGSDPGAIVSGQFDFETVVMHELGHALGLGHSTDTTSVMYAMLGAGSANRNLKVADLNVPDADGGGSSGLHVQAFHPVAAPAAVPLAANGNVALMAWDMALADVSSIGGNRTQKKSGVLYPAPVARSGDLVTSV